MRGFCTDLAISAALPNERSSTPGMNIRSFIRGLTSLRKNLNHFAARKLLFTMATFINSVTASLAPRLQLKVVESSSSGSDDASN
jgi:hypothetical protein